MITIEYRIAAQPSGTSQEEDSLLPRASILFNQSVLAEGKGAGLEKAHSMRGTVCMIQELASLFTFILMQKVLCSISYRDVLELFIFLI